MDYDLETDDLQRMVFTRSYSNFGFRKKLLVFFILAATLLIVQLLYPGKEVLWLAVKLVLMVFSFFALLVALSTPTGSHFNPPTKITFDHQEGVVILTEHTGLTAYIPYVQIKNFGIQEEEKGSKDSRYKVYHIYLETVSGTKWFFYCSGENTIGELIKKLEKLVQPKPFTMPPVKLSPKLNVKETTERSLLYWTNPLGHRAITMSFFTLIGLAVIGFIIYVAIHAPNSEQKSMGFTMAFFVTLLVGAPLSYLLFIMARRFVKDWLRRYALEITLEALRYYEFSKKTGKLSEEHVIPFTNLRKINYCCSPLGNYYYYIKIHPIVGDEIELRTTALTPVERLLLVYWIEMKWSAAS